MAVWTQMNIQQQWFDTNGDPLSGGVLKAYDPGGLVSTSIAIDSSGSSPQASITLNANGQYEVSGAKVIPYIDRIHKWGIFANATDAAADTPFFAGPFDNVPDEGSSLQTQIDGQTQASYATMIAAHVVTPYVNNDSVTITDEWIANEYTIVVSASHGLTTTKGLIVVLDANTYARLNKAWEATAPSFELPGDATDIPSTDVNAALAIVSELPFPAGTYRLTGAAVVVPVGSHIYGPTTSIQGGAVTFSRAAGDYNGFFKTDETDAAFTGIVLENFTITGGSSATWGDVSAKWAIQSHYPFTQLRNIHVEHNSDFFGNGVRLHNDGGQGSMGCWSSELTNVRVVGTTGTTAANGQLLYDISINGGQVKLERISGTRSDIGCWVRSGEDIEMINCNFDNIRSGGTTDRTKSAVVVGEANTRARIKSFKFTGYIEGCGRAMVLQNCTAAEISGYFNALRAFAPAAAPDDGFIYINSTAKNTKIISADIEAQYAGQSCVYSDSVYSIEDTWIFRNVTDSAGDPQTRSAGNVFGGTLPTRENVTAFRLDVAESSTTITASVASGSEISITATGHPFATGDYCWIEGMAGMTEANSRIWQVTYVDANNFTLDGSSFSGTYTSGGNVWTVTTSLDGGEINRQVTYDPPSLTTGLGTTTTLTAPGAAMGDYVQVSHTSDLLDCTLTGYVNPAGTVEVRVQNGTTGTRDIASGTLSVRITKPTAPV